MSEMLLSLTLAGLLAQQLPEPDVSPYYLVAWVTVAFVGGTPGVVAAVLTSRNRNETRREIEAVRHEVMPNSGSSSFDILHRLAWETHERTGEVLDVAHNNRRRIDALESTPCPFQPSED